MTGSGEYRFRAAPIAGRWPGPLVVLEPRARRQLASAGRLWDAQVTVPGGEFDVSCELHAEAGYGLALFGGRFTGKRNLSFGL